MADIVVSKTTPQNEIVEGTIINDITTKDVSIGIDKTNPGWTKNKGRTGKFDRFKRGEIPGEIYTMMKIVTGDKKYWTRDNCANAKKFWAKHPEWEF